MISYLSFPLYCVDPFHLCVFDYYITGGKTTHIATLMNNEVK